MPFPVPRSILSAGRQASKAGKWAKAYSEKSKLIEEFGAQTTEHSITLLDSLLAAMAQHALESGQEPEWLAAFESNIPASERLELLEPLKTAFLSVLRLSHDPILGNEMLALVAAGIHRVTAPRRAIQRVMALAPQLVPHDLELLDRYMREGVERIEDTANGPLIYTRKLLQEDYEIYFLDGASRIGEPVDSYSYNALKHHALIRDQPWFQDPDRPRGRPDFSPLPPPIGNYRHPAFKLEWMLTELGWALLEAATGQTLIERYCRR